LELETGWRPRENRCRFPAFIDRLVGPAALYSRTCLRRLRLNSRCQLTHPRGSTNSSGCAPTDLVTRIFFIFLRFNFWRRPAQPDTSSRLPMPSRLPSPSLLRHRRFTVNASSRPRNGAVRSLRECESDGRRCGGPRQLWYVVRSGR